MLSHRAARSFGPKLFWTSDFGGNPTSGDWCGTRSMLMADDFFLIVHDDRDGRARVYARAVELGLAGAMLGALVLEQRIDIEAPRLRVISPEPPPDPLAHTNLATMIAEVQHREVRTWLQFLGRTAV